VQGASCCGGSTRLLLPLALHAESESRTVAHHAGDKGGQHGGTTGEKFTPAAHAQTYVGSIADRQKGTQQTTASSRRADTKQRKTTPKQQTSKVTTCKLDMTTCKHSSSCRCDILVTRGPWAQPTHVPTGVRASACHATALGLIFRKGGEVWVRQPWWFRCQQTWPDLHPAGHLQADVRIGCGVGAGAGRGSRLWLHTLPQRVSF